MLTQLGCCISFMENDNYWHGGIMKKEDFENAMSELSVKNKSIREQFGTCRFS